MLGRAFLLATLLYTMSGSMAAAQSPQYHSNVGQLLRSCQVFTRPPPNPNVEDLERQAACFAFTDGLAWGVGLAEDPTTRTFCPPEGQTVGQRAAVFVQWAEQNPQRWHEPAAVGVIQALRAAFPCTS